MRLLHGGGEQPELMAASPKLTILPAEKIAAISENVKTEPLLSEARLSSEDYLDYRRLNDPETAIQHKTDMFLKVNRIAEAVLASGDVPEEEVAWAKTASLDFIEKAFTEYTGEREPESDTSFVFAVPTRVMRNFNPFSFHGADYRSEVAPFLPLANYVDAAVVQKLSVGLPPCVIEEYMPNENKQSGKVVFVPIFGDMIFDLVENEDYAKAMVESRKISRKIITDAADFVRERLGAEVMGLGAIIPALTKFGTTIDQSYVPTQQRLETTTGHGGTVHLIAETVRKVMEEADINSGDAIGVVGAAGSIGSSTVATLLDQFDKDVVMSDIPVKQDRLQKMIEQYAEEGERLHIAVDNLDVIRRSNIMVSAITERIDLDQIDPEGALDLTGKVFVDDSQPGCFDRQQVESRGGYLLWVAGHDPRGRVTRKNGYTFGTEEGLVGDSNWGCELEAAVIAATGRTDLTLDHAVTPEDVKAIGGLMRDYGIKPGPFQSFGKLVHIPRKH
ncbi:MAG: hypothetical protein ACREGJ_04990 [Candidatus Saccharimonadales bacterium]